MSTLQWSKSITRALEKPRNQHPVLLVKGKVIFSPEYQDTGKLSAKFHRELSTKSLKRKLFIMLESHYPTGPRCLSTLGQAFCIHLLSCPCPCTAEMISTLSLCTSQREMADLAAEIDEPILSWSLAISSLPCKWAHLLPDKDPHSMQNLLPPMKSLSFFLLAKVRWTK